MHRLFVTLALVLTACTPSPPTSAPASSSAPAGLSASVVEARLPEAGLMAAHPGLARRDGDVLTLSFGGKDVARLTDLYNGHCQGFETCSAWFFNGAMEIGGKTYIQVLYFNGESWLTVLFDNTGRDDWFQEAPVPSPDGHFVAAGIDQDSESGGFLDIVDWTSNAWPKMEYHSAAPCAPQKWLSATTLALTCGNSEKPVPAAAKRQPDGTWTIAPGNYPPVTANEQKPLDPATHRSEPRIGLERLMTP